MSAANLKTMDTPDLWQGIKACFERQGKEVVKMAAFAHELHDRGEKIAEALPNHFPLLEKVYDGSLHPEVMATFFGSIELLRLMSEHLVLEEQVKFLDHDNRFAVLVRDLEGQETVVKVRPHALAVWQARQIFLDGRILTIDEQRKQMPAARTRRATPTPPPTRDEAWPTSSARSWSAPGRAAAGQEDDDEPVTAWQEPPSGLWLALTNEEIEKLREFGRVLGLDETETVRWLMKAQESMVRGLEAFREGHASN